MLRFFLALAGAYLSQAVPAPVTLCLQCCCHGQQIISQWKCVLSVALTIFLPHSMMIYKRCENEMLLDDSFRAEHSIVFYSLQADQVCISILIVIYFKRNLLCWELRDALIYGYKDKNLDLLSSEWISTFLTMIYHSI